MEDRLHRALQENTTLKQQRNELADKLRRVQTQFQRLSSDWRQVRGVDAKAPSSSHGALRPHSAGSPPTKAPASILSPLQLLPSVESRQHGLPPAGTATAVVTTASGTPPHPAVAPVSPELTAAAATAAATPSSAASRLPPITSTASMAGEAELATCRASLAQAQLEVQQLRVALQRQQQPPQSAQLAQVAATGAPITASTAAATAAQQEAALLRSQLQRVQAELQDSLAAQQQLRTQAEQMMNTHRQQLQGGNESQQKLESQYKAIVETLAKEKHELALKVRLMEASEASRVSAGASALPDPSSLIQMQADVHQKTSEVALLNSRLQYAQGQVETLKGECSRLVEELRQSHLAHADTKKALFSVEHDVSTLRATCAAATELEGQLQRKNEENLSLEQELLKMVSSLKECHRETESSVRKEYQSRLCEVQEMRDVADRDRRDAERQLLIAQQDLTESRRAMDLLREDVAMYKGRVATAEKERSALSAKIAFAGHQFANLEDEDVHRALAVAAIKKRSSDMAGVEKDMGLIASPAASPREAGAGAASVASPTANAAANEANKALDLYEALSWDGKWEQGQLREALATAALDLELADTRCSQMSEQVEQYRTLLKKLTEERDTLLEESIALRGRISHVQTIFAKQQLQAYREAVSKGHANDGVVSFSIRGLHCEEVAMARALGLTDCSAPTSIFFTLDGFADYETMMGPTLYSLKAAPDTQFVYDGLERSAVTVADIEATTFQFQLHQVSGASSTLVAMAELPGMTLLAARDMSREELLRLVDGSGTEVGAIAVELSCMNLVMPILLDDRLVAPSGSALTMSAAEVTAAMMALRTVRFLRVHIFRAQGLPGSPEVAASLPQPYVFYTALSSFGGLGCIADTVVHPAGRTFTIEPVFDAAPVDHRVVVDASLIRFIAYGTVAFVVFDERADDVQRNLGVVEVPLRPLLESPLAQIRTTERLHPQGTLSIGLSWVTGS